MIFGNLLKAIKKCARRIYFTLLSIIYKILLELLEQLTHISKYLNNKIQTIKAVNQTAPRDSYKCFY